MPKVYNRKDPNVPSDAVYVGRPTPWGNPYIIGKHGSRGEVVGQYARWLASSPALVLRVQKELRGKDLVCWCAPEICHADILIKEANK